VNAAKKIFGGTKRRNMDVFGWARAEDTEHLFQSTVGATLVTLLPAVPAGEYWLVFACDVTHNDAVAKDVGIVYQNKLANQINVKGTESIAQNTFISLDRPILVSPGALLMGRSLQTIPNPQVLQIRAEFIRLPIGEYLPASPYG
jgi:hypothetical protein